MHELALAEAMIKQAEDIIRENGATCAEKISVEIGALSGVERDAFEFAFPVTAENTLLAEAELSIDEKPATVTCMDCQLESTPELPFLKCDHCDSMDVKITGGKDFIISTMKLRFEEN